jgi:hypothetical protein
MRKIFFSIAGLTLMAAACGGDAGALSVNAAQGADDGRLKVTGWLYAPDPGDGEQQVLLCAGLSDAEPPACQTPSLVLSEVARADLPLEEADGIGWSEDRVTVQADKAGDTFVFAGLEE